MYGIRLRGRPAIPRKGRKRLREKVRPKGQWGTAEGKPRDALINDYACSIGRKVDEGGPGGNESHVREKRVFREE